MAALTATSLNVSGVGTATINTMTASDTLTYVAGTGQLLELHNTTAGSLTVVINNSSPITALPIPNTGATQDLTAGLSIVVAAGAKKFVNLDKIKAYLIGSSGTNATVTLTGAAGLSATLFNQ